LCWRLRARWTIRPWSDLIAQALERAAVRFDFGGKRTLMIRSVSEKQRPRRPAK
jgi:hypothetical protein